MMPGVMRSTVLGGGILGCFCGGGLGSSDKLVRCWCRNVVTWCHAVSLPTLTSVTRSTSRPLRCSRPVVAVAQARARRVLGDVGVVDRQFLDGHRAAGELV